MPDEGGENKICQFLSFSVYFLKLWLRQGGLSFYGSHKGDEGADTNLFFSFVCLMDTGFWDLDRKIRHNFFPKVTM